MTEKITKYETWYNNIVQNARLETRSKGSTYYENHHVVPKSLGGTNEKSNLVLLTAKEHYVCHHLLFKFTSGSSKFKMAFAWRRMSTDFRNKTFRYVNRASFELAKIAACAATSKLNSGPNEKLKKTLRSKSKNTETVCLKNVQTLKTFEGTKFEFLDLFENMTHHEVDRIIKKHAARCKNWVRVHDGLVPENLLNSLNGETHFARDRNVYLFVVENEEFTGTRYALAKRFPHLNVTTQGLTDIIKKRQNTHRNVRVVEVVEVVKKDKT